MDCKDIIIYTKVPFVKWKNRYDKDGVLRGIIKLWDKGEKIDEETKKHIKNYIIYEKEKINNIKVFEFMTKEKILTLKECYILIEKNESIGAKAILLEYIHNNFTAEERMYDFI